MNNIHVYKSRLDAQRVSIEIDPMLNYGILLSGGLDSALLLFLLIKSELNIKIQPFTIPKFDGSVLYANPIIEHFNKNFDVNIPRTIVVGDPTGHHSLLNKIATRQIFSNYKIDILFNALNKVPNELMLDNSYPRRPSSSTDKKVVLPFIELFKTHIVDFMFEYEQQELMKLTHSCTEERFRRCKVCWQCKEREWAFSQLGQIDQGNR